MDRKEKKERAEARRRRNEEALARKLRDGHARPVTRRDFMSHGLIKGSSILLLPSLFEILGQGNRAEAAECGGGSLPQEIVPAVIIDMVGGANLTSIFPPQGAPASVAGGVTPGSQAALLPSYSVVAQASSIGEADVDMSLGAPLRRADPFYGTFTTAASATTRSGTSAVTFCSHILDDNPTNPIGVQTLIARMIGVGTQKLPILSSAVALSLVGPSGGYSAPLLGVEPVHRGLKVGSLATMAEVLGVGSRLVGASNAPQRRALLQALVDLSATQINRAHGQHFIETLKQLVECGFPAAREVVEANLSVDPRADIPANAHFRAVWGIDQSSPAGNINVVRASLLKALFDGLAPAVVFQREGADYHTANLTLFTPFHQDLGTLTGRILETAARLGRKVVVFWITDGNMSWNNDRVPTSDRGEGGMLVMFRYDPAHVGSGPPELNFTSCNYFNDNQGVNRSDFIGPSPRRAALAMALNYAHIAGLVDVFRALVPESEFPSDEFAKYLAFKV